jgi:hypothetical protein
MILPKKLKKQKDFQKQNYSIDQYYFPILS